MKFNVKKPILGFEDVKKVELVIEDENFAFLKDEKGDILFILINPFSLNKNFSFEIPSEIKRLLELKENSNIYVYTNIIKKRPSKESLINFKAPFVFNVENKSCIQIVLEEEGIYPLKDFIKKAS